MVRQFASICASLVITGLLLHQTLASALISRGDDVLRRGHAIKALNYYRRALFFQPELDEVVDRVTIIALMTRDKSAMEIALQLTENAIRNYPRNATFALDRGLLAMRAKHLPEAQIAFERAGSLGRDWQSYAFAALIAHSLGNVMTAKRDWDYVVQINPRFARFHAARHTQ